MGHNLEHGEVLTNRHLLLILRFLQLCVCSRLSLAGCGSPAPCSQHSLSHLYRMMPYCFDTKIDSCSGSLSNFKICRVLVN